MISSNNCRITRFKTRENSKGQPSWVLGISAKKKKPKPGDRIEINRGLYKHWAICARDENVIHLYKHRVSSVKSVLHSKATVKKEKLKKVVQNNEYRINNLLDKQHQPRPIPDILENAESYVGKTLPYDLFTCNCEHFVTKLRYGKGQSKQVQKVVAIAAAVAAAVFFGIFLAVYFKGQNKVFKFLFLFFMYFLLSLVYLMLTKIPRLDINFWEYVAL
ncbi:phospholipase A and acyltransferase 4 [Labeo rohita]|uniref:phospholipase A and acyltransferase 4 n=1 Tax=Labeo rohita TaxID=84645 RepID=UPI0021E2C245|nr:phospholipase A and acyltransferase 4 [Labeo rohita]